MALSPSPSPIPANPYTFVLFLSSVIELCPLCIVNASVTSRPWHVKYITAMVHLFMFLSHTKSDAGWALSRAVILTAVVAVSRLFLSCSIAISTHDIHSHYWQGRERLRRDVSLNCFSQKRPISLLYSPWTRMKYDYKLTQENLWNMRRHVFLKSVFSASTTASNFCAYIFIVHS